MEKPNGDFGLKEFATGLAINLAHQQVRLQRDYEERLKEFKPVLQLAKELGYEEVARTVAPRPVEVGTTTVEARVSLTQTRETEFSIGIKFLNLGYTQKYKHSKFISHALQFSVDVLPLPPGKKKNLS
ncbi:MAG TPA: hypothetical protein VI306_16250 [Pyrinomonadaceae bacterium]